MFYGRCFGLGFNFVSSGKLIMNMIFFMLIFFTGLLLYSFPGMSPCKRGCTVNADCAGIRNPVEFSDRFNFTSWDREYEMKTKRWWKWWYCLSVWKYFVYSFSNLSYFNMSWLKLRKIYRKWQEINTNNFCTL